MKLPDQVLSIQKYYAQKTFRDFFIRQAMGSLRIKSNHIKAQPLKYFNIVHVFKNP